VASTPLPSALPSRTPPVENLRAANALREKSKRDPSTASRNSNRLFAPREDRGERDDSISDALPCQELPWTLVSKTPPPQSSLPPPVAQQDEASRFTSPPLSGGSPAAVSAAPAAEEKRSWFPTRWLGPGQNARGRESTAHVHVDVDAFFASVEQVLNPKLRGKPVLVGRGVVASASYEAKFRGVKTAMSFRDALRICPKAIVVPGQYEHYADFAERVRRILEAYTPAVETAALDDFYLDFAGTGTPVSRLRSHAEAAASGNPRQNRLERFRRRRAHQGGGLDRFPAGASPRLPHRESGEEELFLAPLPVEKLHGIGHIHAAALAEPRRRHHRPIAPDSQARADRRVWRAVGQQIWERAAASMAARCCCPRLQNPFPAKPPSKAAPLTPNSSAACWNISASASADPARIRQAGVHPGRAPALCGPFLRAPDHAPGAATNDERELLAAARELFTKLFTRRVAIRHVGISVMNLEMDRRQNELFDTDANRRWYLNREVDRVRGRYGWNAVFYGKGLELREHYATKPTGLVLSTPCLSR